MTNVHLRLDGTWAECHAVARACPREYHLADMTLEQTELLPPTFVEKLIEPFSAPSHRDVMIRAGVTADIWVNATEQLHRDYGLPAMVGSNGFKVWVSDGKAHRANGPAVENPSGETLWFLNQPDGGELTTEYTSSFKEWWHDGVLVKYEGWQRVRSNSITDDSDLNIPVPEGVEFIHRARR